MSKTLRKLSLVLALVVVASVAQAVEPEPIEPGSGEPVDVLVQGCCWKQTRWGVACGAPVLKKNCAAPSTWVANKSCGTPECGTPAP